MKIQLRASLLIGLSAISAGYAGAVRAAADNPFVGDWKLNPSRSTLIEEMRVESLAAGKYGFDFDGTGMVETILIDGTDQAGLFGTTVAVSAAGADAWKVVRKKDGRVLLIANWKLSKDGNTLTDDFSAISPEGKASTVKLVFKRTASGSGFAGRWDSTSGSVISAFVIQIRPYEGDGLAIVNSASLTRKMQLDGKDYPNTGPNAAILPTSSVRRLDAHTLELVDKTGDGKVYNTEKLELAPDLRTLSVSVQTQGRAQPNILVFERQ